jgi:hypothetical protein
LQRRSVCVCQPCVCGGGDGKGESEGERRTEANLKTFITGISTWPFVVTPLPKTKGPRTNSNYYYDRDFWWKVDHFLESRKSSCNAPKWFMQHDFWIIQNLII